MKGSVLPLKFSQIDKQMKETHCLPLTDFFPPKLSANTVVDWGVNGGEFNANFRTKSNNAFDWLINKAGLGLAFTFKKKNLKLLVIFRPRNRICDFENIFFYFMKPSHLAESNDE